MNLITFIVSSIIFNRTISSSSRNLPRSPSMIFFTHLMVEQDRTARLQDVLIDKTQYGDVVFAAHRRGNNSMAVIDDLLEGAYRHRSST